MNISMRFEGYSEKIIAEALSKGIAKTKAEALRLGLLELNEKYALIPTGDEARELAEDLAEIERIDKDIKSGKEKFYKAKSVSEIFR